MELTKPIQQATLLKRYKRFLADVRLESGEEITVHVPNTGRMTTCWEPEWPCIISDSENTKRKHRFTLEMTFNGTTWIGVNTGNPNKLVAEFIREKRFPSLLGYQEIRTEVPYGTNSRIDILLENDNEKCYIEIKNTTLVEDGIAYFPDAISERGLKHLNELIEMKKQGHRAVMCYLVQREDACTFLPAEHVDPKYAQAFYQAVDEGVEILICQCTMQPKQITFKKLLSLKSK